MANNYFQFKQFTVQQGNSAMKVTTDACLFGAWVAEHLSNATGSTSKRILDIGTGTGLLSLMLAQKVDGKIDAIEIDIAAAEQARENVAASSWADKINVVCGDVKERENFEAGSFDVIVSNPPFYENDLVSPDKLKNNARHDESLKLDELLKLIKYYLKDDGEFYLLMPYKRVKEVIDGCKANGFQIEHLTEVKQTPVHSSFRMMMSGRMELDFKYIKEDMVIKEVNDLYSDRFIELLKDYYLYL